MAPVADQFANVVRELIPINALPKQHQQEVLRRGKVVKYRKGRHLFKQGDKDKFSFFVIEGELELIVDGQLVKQINSDTPDARHALAQLQPRQLSARAKTPLQVFKIDRTVLDRLCAEDRVDDTASTIEVLELEDDAGDDWMTRMLSSDLFGRLPAANIQSLFTTMEAMNARTGDVIVEQGSAGDYYYIVQFGRCLVTRTSAQSGEVTKLAELVEGDCFGEEALLVGAPHNASVTMLTDGRLMRLEKGAFNELIKAPTLSSVTYHQAIKLAEEGAVWLDVRFPDEHKATGIEGSANLPINLLRSKAGELDAEKSYVVYCDSGERSSAGAFLLAQRGFDACYLSDGLIHSPMGAPTKTPAAAKRAGAAAKTRLPPAATKRAGAAAKTRLPPAATKPAGTAVKARLPPAATKPAGAAVKARLPPAPAASTPAASQPARKPAITVPDRRHATAPASRRVAFASRDRRGIDPAASQAQPLARELAELKRELEAMRKLKSEAEAAHRAAQAAMGNSLRTARTQLEADANRQRQSAIELERLKKEVEEARKAVEAERSHKQSREGEPRDLKKKTQTRLQQEVNRLKAEQARLQEHLADLQRVNKQAEREIREEREALKRAAGDASRRSTKAKQLQQELETARRESERKAEKKREELLAMEQRLRADEKSIGARVQEALAVERNKLEAEIADSRDAFGRAQRQAREAAETERRAAEKEAERVIAKHKNTQETVLAKEREKLNLERTKLEGEAERVQRTLAEAQRMQREAQKSQQATQQEIDKRVAQEKAQLSARIQELERQQEEEARLLDDSNRVINPAKIAELKNKVTGKSGGRKRRKKSA